MTMTEEECVHKWAEISDKLKTVDNLINELTKAHQKSAEFDNVQVAKLHQAAAFTMTELEKCNKMDKNDFDFFIIFLVKVRFTLTQEEIKEHSIQIESVSYNKNCRIVFIHFRIELKSIEKRLKGMRSRWKIVHLELMQMQQKGQLFITLIKNE